MHRPVKSVGFTLSVLGWLTFSSTSVVAQHDKYFDFEHVLLSIGYFEEPSDRNLQLLAQTEALVHLKRHSDRTGYYPAEFSKLDTMH